MNTAQGCGIGQRRKSICLSEKSTSRDRSGGEGLWGSEERAAVRVAGGDRSDPRHAWLGGRQWAAHGLIYTSITYQHVDVC